MVVRIEGESRISAYSVAIVDRVVQIAQGCIFLNKEGLMSIFARVKDYCSLLWEFKEYLNEKKSYCLAPVIFVLLLLSALAFFLEGTVIAPAIYSIF